MSRQTIATIRLSALKHNLARVRAMAPRSRVMAVIKADAYGHGLEQVVQALSPDMFCVATVGEAQRVRDAGWAGPLLLLEGFSNAEELALAGKLHCEMVIHARDQVGALEAADSKWRQRLWLKLDTGMHRLGFPWRDAADWRSRLENCTAKEVGLMTHLACADLPDHPLNQQQLERFEEATAGLDGPRSVCNSAGIVNFAGHHHEWVRSGIMLYGLSPMAGQTGAELGLEPVMTLSAELIGTSACDAGDTVGYLADFTCPEPMQVGVAAIGYGDGYPRKMPNGTPVLVEGQAARLAGRVSMDLINIDLRDVPGARVGSPITLWGDGLPAETVAAAAGSIPYELVCGVTSRVKFRYVD